MKDYVKPMVIGTEDVAESIYMASGAGCLTAVITKTGEDLSAANWSQFNIRLQHDAEHHNNKQTIVVKFNIPVNIRTNDGSWIPSGEGTTHITFTRSNNHMECYGNTECSFSVVPADGSISASAITAEISSVSDSGLHVQGEC